MDHVKMLRSVFIERIDAMCAALDTHMPGKDACLRALSMFVFTSSTNFARTGTGCTYSRPKGGYFMWVELPPACVVDAETLLERSSDPNAVSAGVL